MEYEQAAFNQSEIRAPFGTRFQEYCQLFEESRLGKRPRRLDTNAPSVHVVIHNKEVRLGFAASPLLDRFFVSIENGHFARRAHRPVGGEDV